MGAAICRALRLEGARVAVADLDFECARKVASEVSGLAIEVDVSSEQEIIAAVERVESELGPVDIFISNAGVAFGDGPDGAASAKNEYWRACMDINLMAHVYAARVMVPRMKEAGRGLPGQCRFRGRPALPGRGSRLYRKQACRRGVRRVAGNHAR